MFGRAVVAFAAMPGVVAVAILAAGEEPWLARTHGTEWEQNRARVPRWFW